MAAACAVLGELMRAHPLSKAMLALSVAGFALTACAPHWRDGWAPHMGPMMGGWLMMTLYSLLGTFLAVLAALFVFRWLTGGGMGSNAALDMLKQRYAKGEINREEYERAKKDISS